MNTHHHSLAPTPLRPRCEIVDCAFVFSSFPVSFNNNMDGSVVIFGSLSIFPSSSLSCLIVDSFTLLSCDLLILFRAPRNLSLPGQKPTLKPKLLFFSSSNFTCIPRLGYVLPIPQLSIDKKFRFHGFPPPPPTHSSADGRGLVSSVHVHSLV